jgi:tetratricopeptide (TPR) repeat protein
MKGLIKTVIICSLGLGLIMGLYSCNGARAYVKKAQKTEEAGMMDQAATYYMVALGKKPNNTDALIGLKRTGSIVLARHLADFDKSVLLGEREAAISSFENAEDYSKLVSHHNVTLAFPEAKRTLYNSVKNAHVEEIYIEGSEHLEYMRYSEALVLFERIEELVPGFKDAAALADYSFCKPTYELGNSAMEEGKYRTAYEAYDDVVNRDSSFEDASERRQEALETGRYTIALMKFENGSNRRNVHNKVSSYIEQELMSSTDPFLTVVDRESIDLILQEQHLELSGLTSGAELEIGSLLGAKAILKGTVVECSHSHSSLRSDNRKGYEKYRVEAINSEGKKYWVTKYRPVNFTEYNQSCEVVMTFNLKLVSMETGTVLHSGTVRSSRSDNIHYVRYNGDKRHLFPARANGAVNSSISGHNTLVQLIGARRDLKNDDAMVDDISKILASKVLAEVESILREVVK